MSWVVSSAAPGGPRTRIAAGGSATLSRAPVQNVEVTVQTGATAAPTTCTFPSGGVDGDVIEATAIGGSSSTAPTTPTKFVAQGSDTIGDPVNPGFLGSYAATVYAPGTGWTIKYRYDLTNTRWVAYA